MNSALFFDNKKYISAKDASVLTGYSKDYIGQLCRHNKVLSKKIGKAWYVEEVSLIDYKNSPSELELQNIKKNEPIKVLDLSEKIEEKKEPLIAKNISNIKVFSDIRTDKKTHNFFKKPTKEEGWSKSKHLIREGLFATDFSLSKKLVPALLGTILLIGAISVGQNLVQFEANTYKVASSIDQIESYSKSQGLTFSALSNNIAHVPFVVYQYADLLTDFYSDELGKVYLGTANFTLNAGNILKDTAKSFVANPIKGVVGLLDFVSELNNKALAKSKNFISNGFAGIKDNIVSFTTESFRDVSYIGSYLKDSNLGANLVSSVSEDLNPLDRSGVVVYDTVNSWFEKSIYNPLASLFGSKTNIVNNVYVEKKSPSLAVSTTTSTPVPKVPPPVSTPTKTPIVATNQVVTKVVNNTVTQKIIERIISSDLSKDYLEKRLEELNNRIQSQLSQLSWGTGGSVTNIYQQIAQSQRIDQLSGTRITNPTITGGSISGTSISATSISTGPLAASSGVFSGNIILSSPNSYINFNSEEGTNGYGFRDNAGNIEFKNSTGDWTEIGSGGGSGGGTFSTSTSPVAGVLFNYPNNNDDVVVIGATSSTTAKFWFDPNISLAFLANASTTGLSAGYAYFGGTATSSFSNTGVLSLASALAVTSGGTGSTSFSPNAIIVSNSLGTALVATGTQLTVGNLLATSTATSTFIGGISTNLLSVTSTIASSTFSNGINLLAGCFSINNVCISGSGTSGLTSYDAFTHPAAGQSATTSLVLLNGNASTTQLSAYRAYFGGTATTTIDGAGNVTLPSAGLLSFSYSSSSIYSSFLVASTTYLSFGGVLGDQWSDFCVSITGSASLCDGSDDGSGSSDPFSHPFAGISATTSALAVGTSTSYFTFTTASSTGAQLSLSDTTGIAQVTFRNAGGNLYIGTSTTAGNATTSISALEISGTGFGTTTVRGLNISAQATTTSNIGFNITAGCYAVGGVCLSTSGTGLTSYDAWTHSTQGRSATTSIIGVGTTTPYFSLTVASTTGPQLALSNGGGLAQWTLSNLGGNFYLGTTTVAGNATTSISALEVDGVSGTTTVRGLNIVALATTTSNIGFNITAGCYAISTTCLVGYTNSAVQAFIHASTTIPKTYTANVFTALQTFAYSSSTIYSSFVNSSTTIASIGTLTLSSALGATSGGTGQTTYNTGEILYASGSNTLSKLAPSSDGLVLKLNGGVPSWQTDLTSGGGGGATAWSTTTNSMIIYPTDTTDILVLGSNATSTTGNIFEVLGNSLFRGFASTTGFSAYTAYFGGTATSTFGNDGTLTLAGGLNGPLQANNGVVSATTSIGLLYGGTATTTFYNGGVVFSDGYRLTQASSSASFFWSDFNQRLGLGTSTPFGKLSVNSIGGEPAFVVGSSTGTSFIVDSIGNIGIGTTTPFGTLGISASPTGNAERNLINGFFAPNLGAFDVGTAVARNVNGLSLTLNPTASISSASAVGSYTSSIQNLAMSLSGLTLGDTVSNSVVSTGLYGTSINITGTPVLNDTNDSLIGPSFSVIGTNNTVTLTPTLSSVVDILFANYYGTSNNVTITSSGSSLYSPIVYGTSNSVGGNLTTIGPTSHVGELINVSGTADSNYGLRIDGVNNGDANYGIYIVSPGASTTNYAIYSSVAAQSYLAGNLGLATTSPQYLINPFSATAPQIALSAGAGFAQVTLRNDGTNLYISTTTVAGTATTSTSALEIALGGFGTTTVRGLNISAQATSTSNVGFNITTGCFSIGGVCLSTSGSSGLTAYDAFTHPAAGQSATTSLVLLNGQASTTQLSAYRAYFGGTATTTIDGAGNVTLPSAGLLTLSYSSSTIYSSFNTASTTNLIVNGSSFNNLLGSGLTLSSGALTCATSNGSTFGCLSSNDWTTFNNKLGSYDAFTHPAAGQSATTSLVLLNGQASTTQLSAYRAYFGGTATTTIDGAGNVTLPAAGLLSFSYSSSSIYSSFVNSSTTIASIGTLTLGSALGVSSGGTGATTLTGVLLGNGTSPITGATVSSGISGALSDEVGSGFLVFNASPNFTGVSSFGTTTAYFGLTAASSTGAQLSLSDTTGIAQVTFRNAGGNLYIGTSTTAGNATTSISALEIAGSGFGTTTVRGLNISAQATTTSNVGFSITSGCYAMSGTCMSLSSLAGSLALNQGGTATTTFYNGGVVFSDGYRLTQASTSASFFWSDSNQRLGLGTSTPLAKLSVNAVAGEAAFVVGSSTGTSLIVNNVGNVGVGTASPTGRLHVLGKSTDSAVLVVDQGGSANPYAIQFTSAGFSDAYVQLVGNQTLGWQAAMNPFLDNNTSLTLGSASKRWNLIRVGTGASQFDGAVTVAGLLTASGGLTVGTLNGPLQANAGVVSATTSVGILYGGTATTTFYNGGVVFSDGYRLTQASSTSSFFWDDTNKRLGLGTSSPYVKLAVAGSVVADVFNATSTTATSTFAGNIVLGGAGISAVSNSFAGGVGGTVATNGNRANGSGSLAFGNSNASGGGILASGSGSIAMGFGALTSSNSGSIAVGYGDGNTGGPITSSGLGSFAGGYGATAAVSATGDGSFAFGDNVGATASLSTAFGKGYTNALANTFQVGYSSTPTLTVNTTSVGVGTTTPYFGLTVASTTGSQLALSAGAGFAQAVFRNDGTNLYISTTTVAGTATTSTSALEIALGGFGTTTVRGLRISAQATTTSNVGLNLTGGCYAMNSTCLQAFTNTLGSGGTATTTFYNGGVVFSDGYRLTQASSSASLFWSDSNQRLGLGTSTPFAKLSVNSVAGEAAFVVGSSTRTDFIVSSTGKVGIGIASPGRALDILSDASLIHAANTAGTVDFDFDSNGGLFLTNKGFGSRGISITAGSPHLSDYIGIQNDVVLQHSSGGSGGGVRNAVDSSGSVDMDTLYGVHNLISNSNSTTTFIYGTRNAVTSIGTTTNAYGTHNVISNIDINTITNAFGGYFQIGNTGDNFTGPGTITNGYGLYVDSATNASPGGGTPIFANNYGLYINDQGSVGSTNSYNIYSAGGRAKNFFEGKVGVGTTSPYFGLTVASTTGPQFALSAGGALAQVVFRNDGTNLYISTTTTTGNATTSTSALEIALGGFGTTTVRGLRISAQATTTSNIGLNISGGCFAISGSCIGPGSFTNTLAGGGTATTTFYNGGVVFSDGYRLTQASSSASLFWSDSNTRLGLGTSTPFAKLSVNSIAGEAAFVVGSSTGTSLIVDNIGNVGIGTTTPFGTLGISASPTGNREFNLINAFSAPNLGTFDIGTAGTRNTNGLALTFNPTASISSASAVGVYNSSIQNLAMSLSGLTIGDTASNSVIVASIYGANVNITGTPVINDTNDSTSGPSLGVYGTSNSIALTPTLSSVADPLYANYYGTYNTVSITSAGSSFYNPTVYGSNQNAGGNLTTVGLTSHVGELISVSGTADSNYGLRIDAVNSADANYGIYIVSPGASTTNYAIHSSSAAQSYLAGNLGLATTSPQWILNPFSATAPQLALSAGAGQAQLTLRNAGGNLYISTTTVAGTATTSISALEIDGTSGTTTVRGLNIVAQATTTTNIGFSISGGCYAVNNVCLANGAVTGMTSYDAWTHSTQFLNTSATTSIIGIGTTTPYYSLTVASSTGPQFALSDTTGIAQWAFRNSGGNLYLATTTVAGISTTSISALEISGSGFGTTTVRGLNISAQASTTANIGFNLSGGCYAIGGNCIGTSATVAINSGITGGTAGSVLFVGSGGLAQDNANFFWKQNASILGLGTTTPTYTLTIASTTGTQLALSNGAGIAQWSFANLGGNLYLGTTTVAGNATTSISALEISGSGFGTTTVRGLNISAQATTTANIGFNLTGGCYAIGGSCIGAGSFSNTLANGGTATTTFYSGGIVFASTTFLSQSAQTENFFWQESTRRLGLGTSTPFAKLSINSVAGESSFVIGSSTKTYLEVNKYGTLNVNVSSTSAFNVEDGLGGDVFTVDTTATSTNSGIDITAGTSQSGNLLNIFQSDGTTNYVVVSSAGSLGIATATPWRALSVNGTVGFAGLSAFPGAATSSTLCLNANNEVTRASGMNCYVSSLRFKQNVNDITTGSSMALLNELRPVTFEYKSSPGSTFYGFIAEEVDLLDRSLVSYDENGLPYSVNYIAVVPLLTQATQEINLKIETLASTTASTTPESLAFAESFFGNLFNRITTWLASATNGIVKFFAKEVHTDTLCVSDSSGETCISKTQLDALLANAVNGGGAPSGGSGNGGGGNEGGEEEEPTDTTEPVITIVGNNPATIDLGSSYADLGATVTDTDENGAVNNNLGIHFNVNGIDVQDISFDTSTSTTHTIIYSSQDGAGNIGTATRIVNVVDPNATTTTP